MDSCLWLRLVEKKSDGLKKNEAQRYNIFSSTGWILLNIDVAHYMQVFFSAD